VIYRRHVFRASPLLKDAEIPSSECASLYAELLSIMRKMFHKCKLVHADLSEYNILYHEGHLCIIDVSQSVEHDHPAAFKFLRKDIKNVEEFFGRLGVKVFGLRKCFDLVTRVQLTEDDNEVDEEAILTAWLDEPREDDIAPHEEGSTADGTTQGPFSADEDSVFLQSFIPRTLNEVYDPERDVEKIARGEGDGLIYSKTIGIVSNHANGGPKTPALSGTGLTACLVISF